MPNPPGTAQWTLGERIRDLSVRRAVALQPAGVNALEAIADAVAALEHDWKLCEAMCAPGENVVSAFAKAILARSSLEREAAELREERNELRAVIDEVHGDLDYSLPNGPDGLDAGLRERVALAIATARSASQEGGKGT